MLGKRTLPLLDVQHIELVQTVLSDPERTELSVRIDVFFPPASAGVSHNASMQL